MKAVIFYSWQSDLPPEEGKELIRIALTKAIQTIADEAALVARPEIDHDTKGIPGSPSMVATILKKIDECSVFVADVTLTHQRRLPAEPRTAPNPNVMFELGYALKRLGRERIVLLQNTKYGGPSELPFDLRGDRVIEYRHDQADLLTTQLREALHLVLSKAGLPPDLLPTVEIQLKRVDREIRSERHAYRLSVRVQNTGDEILSNWSVEISFPRALLEPTQSYDLIVREQDGIVVMRQTEANHSGPIYPGDTKELLGIDYYMDDALYEKRNALYQRDVDVFFFVESRCIARRSSKVKGLVNF